MAAGRRARPYTAGRVADRGGGSPARSTPCPTRSWLPRTASSSPGSATGTLIRSEDRGESWDPISAEAERVLALEAVAA